MSGRGKTAKVHKKTTYASKLVKPFGKLIKTRKVSRKGEIYKDAKAIINAIENLVEVDPVEYLKKVVKLLTATLKVHNIETLKFGEDRDEELITDLDIFIASLAEKIHPIIKESIDLINFKEAAPVAQDELGGLINAMTRLRPT